MSGAEHDPEILRYGDHDISDHPYLSDRGQLNRAYYERFTSHQAKYGGAACTNEDEVPVNGPATLFLTGYDGDDPSESTVYTSEVTLREGDSATITTGDKDFRVKFKGLSINRNSSDHIVKNLDASFSIDVWDDDEGRWYEIEVHTGTSDDMVFQYQGSSVRIVLHEAPGFDPERDFEKLVEEGLSPAEALDYWMVETRGHPQSEWAETRSRSQQAVSKNIRSAKDTLGDPEEREI